MADRTGLEPATSGVTGRHSNQLNYRSADRSDFISRAYKEWWVMTGSNRRPSACKADALPAELITLRLMAAVSLSDAAHYKQPNDPYAISFRHFFYKYP